MHRFIALLFFVSTACLANGISAWHDADGHAVFGDQPPANVHAKVVKVHPNVYDNPNIVSAPVQLSSRHEVTMYGASWCKYCAQAKAYFQAHNIPYTEYDVETSEKGRHDYAALGGGGIPIILVGSQRLNGFSPSAFEQIYAQAQN